MSLLSLPSDVWKGSLFPLLSAACMTKFDTAACDRNLRPHVLQSLVGTRVSLECADNVQVLAITWLEKRKMFVENVSISGNRKGWTALLKNHQLTVFKHLELELLHVQSKGDMSKKLRPIAEHIGSDSLLSLSINGNLRSGFVDERTVVALLSRQRNLRRFAIEDIDTVTDNVLVRLASYCPLLEDLSIAFCWNVVLDNDAGSQLFSSCPLLRKFRFARQPYHPQTCFDAIIHYCSSLEELDFYNCWNMVTDETIMPILERCSNLRVLQLGSTAVTKKGFAHISRLCSRLTQLTVPMRDEDPSIPDGFRLLSNSLTTFCGALHPNTAQLSAVHWGKVMRKLNLWETLVSDALLVSIARHCGNLEELIVADGLGSVTDTSMRAFASQTPFLKLLQIEGGRSVTDAGVLALSSGCVQLTRLILAKSTQLTDAGLLPLIEKCTMLESVEVEATACCTVAHRIIIAYSSNRYY